MSFDQLDVLGVRRRRGAADGTPGERHRYDRFCRGASRPRRGRFQPPASLGQRRAFRDRGERRNMSTTQERMTPAELQQAARDHLWFHFTRMGGYADAEVPVIVRGDGCYLEDVERQALPRRARRSVLREHRLRLRRGDRRGGGCSDARAALLHQLDVRPSPGDRARRGGGRPGTGRPQPRLLRLGRLRGRRGRLEARAPVPRRARRAPLEGGRQAHRLPRDDDGRPLAQRHRRNPQPVRAARARRRPRPQHEPLPPAGGGDRGGVHRVPARGPRVGDRAGRPGHRRDGHHGAGAELGRLLHAAGRATSGVFARSATATASSSAPTR